MPAPVTTVSASDFLRVKTTLKKSERDITVANFLAAVPAPISVQKAETITGATADAYAGLELSPTFNAATALTITRGNYINLKNPTLGGAGPAALTDACVFRFDAAAGTHKAVDAGTTKTTPGAVTQWLKANVNGVLAYIPSYASKTT